MLVDDLSRNSAQQLIADGNAVATPQDHDKATYAPMLDKSMAYLDFDMSAKKIQSFIRGLNPWPIAKFTILGQEVKVFSATRGNPTECSASTVLAITDDGLEIACGDGNSIVLKMLQRPGKKAVDGYSFAQGLRLKVGDKLI